MSRPRRRHGLVFLGALVASTGALGADGAKLAPGRDPAGLAVAILADGFDATSPDLARVVARDGEGEAIAWDAVDDDPHPFQGDGRGTEAARIATALGGVRIVPVRAATGDQVSLAKAVAFADATPARIVLVVFLSGEQQGRNVLAAAAQRFARTLFVGTAPDLTDAETAHAETAPNLLMVRAPAEAYTGAALIAQALGCGQSAPAAATGAALKQAVLSRTQADSTAPARCAPDDGQQSGQP